MADPHLVAQHHAEQAPWLWVALVLVALLALPLIVAFRDYRREVERQRRTCRAREQRRRERVELARIPDPSGLTRMAWVHRSHQPVDADPYPLDRPAPAGPADDDGWRAAS